MPANPPIPPRVALASQMRATYAVLAAQPDGVTLETYTRPGLLGVIAAIISLQAKAAPVLPPPPAREPADF